MKQYKVYLTGIGTGKSGWRNVHANSTQEAYDKMNRQYGLKCEISKILKHGRTNKKKT